MGGADIIVGKNIQFIDGSPYPKCEYKESVKCSSLSGKQACIKLICNHNPYLGSLWGKIYKKELFEKINYSEYKETLKLIYFEDGFIIPKLFKNSEKIKVIDESVILYRVLQKSLSHSNDNAEYFMNFAEEEK